MCTLTGSGWTPRAADIHLPVVEGAADNSILPWLQHHITADKFLHRSLAVGHQAAQSELVAAAEGGAEDHDAQVQQVAVGRVGAPGEMTEGLGARRNEGKRCGFGFRRQFLFTCFPPEREQIPAPSSPAR